MRSLRKATFRTIAIFGALAVLGGACASDEGDSGGETASEAGGAATTDEAMTDEAGGESETGEPTEMADVELEDSIVIAGSGGELGASYQASFADWAEENGVRIQWVEGLATDHLGRLVAQKNNPEVDLFQGELVSHFAAATQGVFQPMDPAIVTNLAGFPEKAVVDDASAVNHVVEVVGAWWNQEKFDEAGLTPPETWEDFWALTQDPALQGHVVFPSIDNGYMRSWIAVQLEDASDPAPIYEQLAGIDSAVLEYPRAPAAMFDLAVAGEAWLGVNGFTRILDMLDADVGIDYVIPERAPLVPMSWSLIKDGPHPNASQALLNYIMSPEGQLSMATETGLSPMLPGVEVDGDNFLTPEEISHGTAWDYATVQESLESWRTKFAEIVREIAE